MSGGDEMDFQQEEEFPFTEQDVNDASFVLVEELKTRGIGSQEFVSFPVPPNKRPRLGLNGGLVGIKRTVSPSDPLAMSPARSTVTSPAMVASPPITVPSPASSTVTSASAASPSNASSFSASPYASPASTSRSQHQPLDTDGSPATLPSPTPPTATTATTATPTLPATPASHASGAQFQLGPYARFSQSLSRWTGSTIEPYLVAERVVKSVLGWPSDRTNFPGMPVFRK